jgi:hypothetical protein
MEKDRSPEIDENLSPMMNETLPLGDQNLSTLTDEAPFTVIDENPDEHPSQTTRGRSFEKGKSGNPAGRPKGARNRTTLAAEALLEGQAEAITQKVVDMALEGDLTAARMCLDRILPIRRERRVSFDLPPINSAEDVVNAMRAIAAALASGELSPSEAAEAGSFVGWHAKAIEVFELEQRIILLEQDHHAATRFKSYGK